MVSSRRSRRSIISTLSLPIAGGVGLAIGLLIFATQPIRPSPIWRAIPGDGRGSWMAVVFFLGLLIFSRLSVFVLQAYHAREVLPTYSERKDAIGPDRGSSAGDPGGLGSPFFPENEVGSAECLANGRRDGRKLNGAMAKSPPPEPMEPRR